MYWLAQTARRRRETEFVDAHSAEAGRSRCCSTCAANTPRAELSARSTQATRRQHHPNTSTDERLCEALFYVGEEYWARGQPTWRATTSPRW
jgi:hypothetical protein